MPIPPLTPQPCPCGGFLYGSCCAPLHRGERRAATAEQLMRSRYSAFALGEVEHLLRTQGPDLSSRQPLSLQRRALQDSCRQLQWLRLEILAAEAGGPLDLEGTVTFRAHYQEANRRGMRGRGFTGLGEGRRSEGGRAEGGSEGGRRGVLRERSRFGREGGRPEGDWLYLEALELSG